MTISPERGSGGGAPIQIEVRVHQTIRDLSQARWDALAGVAEAPFLRWAWLDAMETAGCVGGDTGWLPHHLSFWEGDELVAAAPAYLKDNSEGEFVFDWSWASASERARIPYYPKLIVAVPFTPATGVRLLLRQKEDRARLMPALAGALGAIVKAEEISGAHVLFPLEEEANALAAAGLMHRLGMQFHWHNHGYATFEDYLGKFSSKRRTQIRRERKEMGKQGITIETLSGKDLTPKIIDAGYAFYLNTVDKFTWGRRYLNRAFFETVCKELPGSIELVVARDGKKPIAGAWNLVGDRVLYGRYWGCVEERPFLHFNVCFYHAIEECIKKGFTRFEPGAGGGHKLVRGFEPSLTHSAHYLAHPGLRRAIGEYLEREREAMRETVARGEDAFR